MEYVWNENDFDLDLHQIWEESDLPAPPPCLATEFDETKPESPHAEKTMHIACKIPLWNAYSTPTTRAIMLSGGWGRAHCFSRQSPRISSSTFQPSCQRK
ncbi:uncharacterized protein N7483_011515 [Penicillium malachiteum]|uniref:uncharacterized protein n=1 Tax=Penicillium malachiteum TaxID=1324776 RepID=UPI002548177F|nr:uncharacterized protein N7483_011515 [Penicillium malachiteum]KAJ5714334.1 hypothetical protein N7483_011515 [Penicillium malachiteum]